MDETLTLHLHATRAFLDAFRLDVATGGRVRATVMHPAASRAERAFSAFGPTELMRVARDWRSQVDADVRAVRVAQALETLAATRCPARPSLRSRVQQLGRRISDYMGI